MYLTAALSSSFVVSLTCTPVPLCNNAGFGKASTVLYSTRVRPDETYGIKNATNLNVYSLVLFKKIVHFIHEHYSVLKLFTGFDTAALMVFKLTTKRVSRSTTTPTTANIHKLMSIR